MKTYILWNWLLDGAPPAVSTIMVDNLDGGGLVPVVGDLTGSGTIDLCWLKQGGASYLADVTGLGIVAFGAANNISGATDKPVGADPAALGEGLTILVVYEIAGRPARSVDVYAGYASTESDIVGRATVLLTFSEAYTGGNLHFFINGLDGQLDEGPGSPRFLDEFFINGIPAPAVAGGVPGDAWQGLLFAAPPAPGPPPVANWLYDHTEGEISSFVASPALDVLVETITPLSGDCIGHSLAAVSFPLHPIPTVSEWGLIAMTLLLLIAGTVVILRRGTTLPTQ
ncbi:MAG: IPTL-CTERM sorting domain-containing protein [Phycisphaerae bacterium]